MPSKTTTPLRQKAEAIAATRAKIGTDGKPVTTGERAKVKATKAATAPKRRGPVSRLTESWKSKAGREVKIGDTVKTPDGFVITVFSRWTARTNDGTTIPKVTGKIVTAPAGATADARKGSQNRAAVAATLVHVKAN